MKSSRHKVLLAILDGWGLNSNPEQSAIFAADTPNMDSYLKNYPHTTLTTFGEQVGLPEGQMGNSEVGHLNIGAGRVVYQQLALINKEIREDTLKENQVLVAALKHVKGGSNRLHLVGLLSDGGVHSHINHLKALCRIAIDREIEEVYLHLILDGRDTDPEGGATYLKEVIDLIQGTQIKIATIIGRYYAMDRDRRWERTRRAYDLMVKGESKAYSEDAIASVKKFYKQGITDEFMEPILMEDTKEKGLLQPGDTLLCFNFRSDRPRQIMEVLSQTDFPEYEMKRLSLEYLTMTEYSRSFHGIKVLFPKDIIRKTLGEVIADHGLSQLRIAETEKYPHVTYFFSGGREEEFDLEQRILVNSPKVATYDLKPEMSAEEVTDKLIESLQTDAPDFICLNFANPDMVGHTGVFSAAVKAVETIDTAIGNIVVTALKNSYSIIIIADHGNADFMVNPDGSPHTAHTTNPVPMILIENEIENKLKAGKLADIAPTILNLMKVSVPKEMTGDSLII